MKVFSMKAVLSCILLSLPGCVFSANVTYTLDKEQVCNTIFNSPQLNNFVALREFFRVNPAFADNINVTDIRYCLKLKAVFSISDKTLPEDQKAQMYQNCMNMTDEQIAAENQSFIIIQSVIRNCQL